MAEKSARLEKARKSFVSRLRNLEKEITELTDRRGAIAKQCEDIAHRIQLKRDRLREMKNPVKIKREEQAIAKLERELADIDLDRVVGEIESLRRNAETVRASLATTERRIEEARNTERLERERQVREEEERRKAERKAERHFKNRVRHRKQKMLKRLVRNKEFLTNMRGRRCPLDPGDPLFDRVVEKRLGGDPNDEADRRAAAELLSEVVENAVRTPMTRTA